MKSNQKTKIVVLLIIGIFFAFLSLFMSNLGLIIKEHEIVSNRKDVNLKISAVSGKIHIDGNSGWAAFQAAGNCTGSGNYTHPYVIEDLEIDGGGTESCILIENSELYFRIENCTLYNSGDFPHGGILLNNTENGSLVDNTCHNNYNGIHVSYYSNNNWILGNNVSNNDFGIALAQTSDNIIIDNIANYNNYSGINLFVSNNNTISENSAYFNLQNGINLFASEYNNISGNLINHNEMRGISLVTYSNFNTISSNTANNNQYGIYLYRSDNNTISENILKGNNICIEESESEDNNFQNNKCVKDGGIPGYNLFFLLGILSLVVIILIKKIKKI